MRERSHNGGFGRRCNREYLARSRLDIVGVKHGRRLALLEHRLLIRLGRWVVVPRQLQLSGVVARLPDGRVLSVIGFTIAGGKVVEMDILADPDRLSRLDLSAIEP